MVYNIMSCSGFGTDVLGGCSLAWFGIGALIIGLLVLTKQLNDLGFEFDTIWGGIGAFVPYIIIITITG